MTTPFPFTPGQTLTAAQLNAITELVVNDKTASHTLTAADAGDRVIMNSASATTITVNTSVFTAGQVIYVTNKGAGVCTITAGTATVSTTGTLALSQFASGVLYCISAGVFLFEGYATAAAASAVVQLKSTAKTDTFTTSSASYVDVTGLSVSITPTSATNKILVVAFVSAFFAIGSGRGFMRLVRDSTAIGIGDAAGGRTQASGVFANSGQDISGITVSFLDSPATTAATTYKIQIFGDSGQANINRDTTDNANAAHGRTASTITVMEVTP